MRTSKVPLMRLPSARTSAVALSVLLGGLAAFQLALALGAPLGRYAMGGAFEGAYPPPMRIAALVQLGIYVAVAWVMLARAGVLAAGRPRLLRALAWAVVGLFAVGVVLNLISPSLPERLLWTPVAVALALLSLRVALS
jgi:hypothetical protein